MVDYLNAFDESYIPLNIQEGIEMMTEEVYDTIQNEYRYLQFNKDYSRVVQGLLEEDYPLIKEAAHSIKGTLGYLLPLVLEKLSNELQMFILNRIDNKTEKAKYPFLPQDKIKVYKDGIVILTEMIALQRYFTKKFPNFDTPFKKEEAKQLIDQVYKKQQEIIKANSSPANGTEKKIAGSQNNIEKQASSNQVDNEKLKKSQATNIETSMKIKDSQQISNNNNNNNNNIISGKSLKESTAKQHTQENEQTREKDNKSQKKSTNGSALIAVPEKNNEDIDIGGQGNQNLAEESALKSIGATKEEGVGTHDIKLESHEKVQPCCKSCNIF